jgi:hypothetical protein
MKEVSTGIRARREQREQNWRTTPMSRYSLIVRKKVTFSQISPRAFARNQTLHVSQSG